MICGGFAGLWRHQFFCWVQMLKCSVLGFRRSIDLLAGKEVMTEGEPEGNRTIMFHPTFQGDTDRVLRRQQMTMEIHRSMHTSQGVSKELRPRYLSRHLFSTMRLKRQTARDLLERRIMTG